jgi:N-hydroxyarylamine O-acetyltransferase
MFYPVRRPKTHMVLCVRADGRDWLCDLGFGSYGIRAPLALDALDSDIAQDHDRFRLSRDAQGVYLLQAWVDGEWANQYGFDLHPQEWIDFAPANYLNSTHPEAIFVQKLLVVRHTPRGRHILLGERLKTIEDGVSQLRELGAAEVAVVLREVFALAA